MNPHAPAVVLPSGVTFTLLEEDGRPPAFMARWRRGDLDALLAPVTSGDRLARWRYTLDSDGRVVRVERAATPGVWTTHEAKG